LENQVGVPVANSAAISVEASAGLVMATARRDDGRAVMSAAVTEAGSTSRSATWFGRARTTVAMAKTVAAVNFILIFEWC